MTTHRDTFDGIVDGYWHHHYAVITTRGWWIEHLTACASDPSTCEFHRRMADALAAAPDAWAGGGRYLLELTDEPNGLQAIGAGGAAQ